MQNDIFYLKNIGGSVVCYTDRQTAIEDCGGWDATCTQKEWEDGGCVARVIDGKIYVGMTPQEKIENQARRFRLVRDTKLRKCDKMSPLRWESLSEEKRQEWRDYRQALLDIPQREGFPWEGPERYNDWPKEPE